MTFHLGNSFDLGFTGTEEGIWGGDREREGSHGCTLEHMQGMTLLGMYASKGP